MITDGHFMTAGHCVQGYPPESLTVIMGAHDLKINESTTVIFDVANVTVHPQYDNVSHKSDIAILTLKKPLTKFSEFISIGRYERQQRKFVGTNITVLGWGLGSNDVLSQAQLTVVDNQECQNRSYLQKVNNFN